MSEPNPAIGYWLTFTIDHNEADAAEVFRQRHGQPSEHILEDRRYHHPTLKVGPVPEENNL